MATTPTADPTCAVVRVGETFDGKQGLSYVAEISAETVGATGICMDLVTLPPGGRAKAHLHAALETAIYVLGGEAVMWFGEGLRQRLTVRAGEFLSIPAGMPNLPTNASETEPCVAVLARTDPNEQESVVLLPELDVAIADRPAARRTVGSWCALLYTRDAFVKEGAVELLTVQETAQILKVAPITVRRYIASGRLAAVKIGRGVRVRREAIDEVLTPARPRVLHDPDDDETFLEGHPTSEDDPLWRIVGMFDSGPDGPTDVSTNKHKYLAEAYADLHEE